jgi:cellulose synthase/poly-beta-1,6-N-acetylglucosamine synthase-like glycosyltransferase
MKPFFSIVIPTKNNADLIGKCLQSLWELDYPQDRIEVIVSDGMSTDKTKEIAEFYAAKVVLDYHNTSVCSARNAAFAVVKGEFVAMCDADCVVDKNWLENALKYFDDSKVGGIGGANLIPEDETPFGKAVGLFFAYAPFIVKSANTRVLKKVIESRSHGSNAIYRAEVLKKVTPIEETVIGGEDVIMNDKINDLGYKLLYVPDVLVYHYRRPNPVKWWKSMYRYGMGRVILPRHRKGEVSLVHIITGWSFPILVTLILTLAVISPILILWLISGLLVLAIIAMLLAYIAIMDLAVAVDMPVVLGIFVMAWSFGYLHELFCPSNKRRIKCVS